MDSVVLITAIAAAWLTTACVLAAVMGRAIHLRDEHGR